MTSHPGSSVGPAKVVPTPIKERFGNFWDHWDTHNPHRQRFNCDWPGCTRHFTRERDQKRHIKKDHLYEQDQLKRGTTGSQKRKGLPRKTRAW
ncbi:transcription factor [Ganoderma sinense ZZ0214-1]|uniref:Transcription factor n=1 Tax=Ganoderma sinense ZZ0214-1 TaxID=1077348 RepID=A0A2G8S789_9APHY|nr:transcription factor [Ganoderma sinense ZZ0214-1]